MIWGFCVGSEGEGGGGFWDDGGRWLPMRDKSDGSNGGDRIVEVYVGLVYCWWVVHRALA